MKTRALVLLFFVTLAFGSMALLPDDGPMTRLLSRLERFHAEHPVEKVYLHLDRPYYAAGDTIWFKAYVVNGTKNELSGLSKVLYIDLIGQDDSVKRKIKLPIYKGLSWGNIALADSLLEGSYRLRAYTSWMRNNDEAYFYDRTLDIGPNYANKVFGKVEYSYPMLGDRRMVEAVLSFVDEKGLALSGKEVRYQVTIGDERLARGRNFTDDKGQIRLSFAGKGGAAPETGTISATMTMEGDKVVTKLFSVKKMSDATDIQFFAEGGDLVTGLASRLAVKATGTDGEGRVLSGDIKDQTGALVISVNTGHAGMTSFLFTPEEGKQYTGSFTLADGSVKTVALPVAKASGYVLAVNNRKDLLVSIQSSADKLGAGQLTLLIQQNGLVKYLASSPANRAEATAHISKARLSTGIAQLTLFDKDAKPVAERLVFINNPETVKLSMSTDKEEYAKRSKVNMKFSVRDSIDSAGFANFSLAVINETKVPVNEDKEPNIYTNLLLSSDLKGYIQEPAYYFRDAGPQKEAELDNLMLTQGWRRFSWQSINDSVARPKFDVEQGIVIKGQITNDGKKPMPNARLLLMATKGSVLILDTVADEQGRFSFGPLSLPDSVSVIIQARKAKGGKFVNIRLDNVPPLAVNRNPNTGDVSINMNESMRKFLQARAGDIDLLRRNGMLRRNIVLDEVKIVEKKPATEASQNLNGAGRANYVLQGEKLQNFMDIYQALMSVPGLLVQNGVISSTRSPGRPMQVVVDGMFMEPDMLNTLIPQDIQSIEVLRTIEYLAIYGGRGANGVLVITTRRGDPGYVRNSYAPGIMTFHPQGYSYTREFYAPRYDKGARTDLPDLRNTVYWQPNVTSDMRGEASTSFFTGSEPGTYRIVIEGLNGQGAIFRRVKRISVK